MPRTYLRFEPDDQFGCIGDSNYLTHDGRFVISVSFDQISIRALSTGQVVGKLNLNRDCRILCSCQHPRLNEMFVGTSDNYVQLFNVDK